MKFTRLVGGIPNFLNKSKIARRFVYFVCGLILLKLFYNAIFWSDDKIPSIAGKSIQKANANIDINEGCFAIGITSI